MKNRSLTIIYSCFFLLVVNPISSQNISLNDLKGIADQVNSELKGQDIGNGVSLRSCIATGRTLNYYYDVPNSWLPPQTIKEDLLENFRTIGVLEFYRTNGVNLRFFYYKGNKVVKKLEINNTPNNLLSLELADYVNLQGHPKGKDVNLKLKSPKNWHILEGDRPNILKKFIDDSNVFLVLIKDNMTFFSRNESKELLTDPEFQKDFISESGRIFKDYHIHNQRIITVDTYPTLEYLISGNLERSGVNLELVMKVWLVIYEDKLVHFQAFGLDNGSFKEREQLYSSIINSVIFPDQYNY